MDDANYVVTSPIAMVAYKSITATRQVTMPAANSYNPGQLFTVVDESGGCSSTININILAGGSDRVNGASGTSIITKYGYVAMESDGISKWTIVDSCNFAFIDSPGFIGSPTSTTPAQNDNSKRIATTDWYAGQAGAANPVAPGTAAPGTSLLFARQDHVHPVDTSRAPIAAPTFTGAAKAVTAALNDNSTLIATTAFFAGQASAANPVMSGTAAPGVSLRFAREDHVHPVDTSRAPLDSPDFAGIPKVPTALATDASKQAANTAFVAAALAATQARSDVNDADYQVLATDRTVAFANLSVARTVTLPAASAFPKGATLLVVDESGNCSATKTITIAKAGTDTVNKAASAVMTTAFGYFALESDGVSRWTITANSTVVTSAMIDQSFGSTAGSLLVRTGTLWTALAPGALGGQLLSNGAGNAPSYGNPAGGFRNLIINGNFTINQRGQNSGNTLGAGAYGHDRWRAGLSNTCTYFFTAGGLDTQVNINSGTLMQVVETWQIEGGTYTLSWSGTARARMFQGASSSAAFAASPLTVTGLSALTNLNVEFSTGTVGLVSLASGSYAVPFERRPRTIEQLLCFRYYQVRSLGMRAWVGANLVSAYPYSLPFPMAGTPTVTRISTASQSNVTSSNITMQNNTDGKYAVVSSAANVDLITTGDVFSFAAEF